MSEDDHQVRFALGDPEVRSIGDVINMLRDEFPEVTVSKVRFLEGQGLIDPARSDSGYRLFSDADVERLRFILREQRDHYLPLKVIKSKLTAWDRGEEPPDHREADTPPETYFSASGISMAADELSRSSGLTRSQIFELTELGLLEPMELPDGETVYRDDDLTVARAAARLLRHGLEGRHLRSFRLAADRQSDLFRQLVEPLIRHRNPDNRRRAAEILADTAQAGALLHEAMVRSRLQSLLEG